MYNFIANNYTQCIFIDKLYKQGRGLMKSITEMTNNELVKFTNKYITDKMKENENIIRYSFYEIRVKMDMEETDVDKFLKCSRNILEDLDYKVYFTGAKFVYENANRTVQDNELMIAIKDI